MTVIEQEESKSLLLRQKKANLNCNTCPRCGETKTAQFYLSKGIKNKGLFCYCENKRWYEGFFYRSYYQIDYHYCLTCNLKWGSKPYFLGCNF